MVDTHGRGAWPNSGAGGTKAYKSSDAGPYYYLGSGDLPAKDNLSNYAVRHAVKAYQRALNRRLGDKWTLKVDGHYGDDTAAAVLHFQKKRADLVDWGGIGPDTSRSLLIPDLLKEVDKSAEKPLTASVVSGLIRHESGWDAGAVGYVDPHDLGLAQINGPSHPNYTKSDRFRPRVAFEFVINYMNNALDDLDGNLRDAIASYNLGLGGVRRWIDQGRPELYTPEGSSTARNVWAYIDGILEG